MPIYNAIYIKKIIDFNWKIRNWSKLQDQINHIISSFFILNLLILCTILNYSFNLIISETNESQINKHKHKIIKLKIWYPVCIHLYNEYIISTIVTLNYNSLLIQHLFARESLSSPKNNFYMRVNSTNQPII